MQLICMQLIGGKVCLCSLILLKEEALVTQEGNRSGPRIKVADTRADKLSLLSDIY